MAISFIGAGAAEATTITIPGSYQAGDLLVIFAFRDGSTTAPTIPTGWTTLNTGNITGASVSIGYKTAISNSDTSGTWTNATELCCWVCRGQATNKTPVGTPGLNSAASGTSITYNTINPMKCAGTSWVIGVAGHTSIDGAINTAPTNMTNRASINGATASAAVHDTNGSVSTWPSTAASIGGTSGIWISRSVEIFAEQMSLNNYMGMDAGDGMSVGEKIR